MIQLFEIYTSKSVLFSHARSDALLPENRETVSGCGGTHAGGPIFGERGEYLQADDQVHHRDADRRLRQGTERQGQVLVVLVPRIRHARDRPRSCEMLTAPRVGLVLPRHLEREKASRRRFLRGWRRGQLSSLRWFARRQHVAATFLRGFPEKREMRARGVLRRRPRRPEIFFPPRAGLAIKRLRILRKWSRVSPSGSLRKKRAVMRSKRAARLSRRSKGSLFLSVLSQLG